MGSLLVIKDECGLHHIDPGDIFSQGNEVGDGEAEHGDSEDEGGRCEEHPGTDFSFAEGIHAC